MSYVLVKRGRFMEGHSYTTAHGYSFSWTKDREKARVFAEGDPSTDTFANKTGARIERVADGVSRLDADTKPAQTPMDSSHPDGVE